MLLKDVISSPISSLLLFSLITTASPNAAWGFASGAASRKGHARASRAFGAQDPLCAADEACAGQGRSSTPRAELFDGPGFSTQLAQNAANLTATRSKPASDPVRSVKVVFGEMSFAPHSERLTDVGAGRCQLVLKKFRQRKNVKVVVESASGEMRARDEDLALNRRRAEALKEQLNQLGVPREQMTDPTLGVDERGGRPDTDWARPTPPKVEFTVRAPTSS